MVVLYTLAVLDHDGHYSVHHVQATGMDKQEVSCLVEHARAWWAKRPGVRWAAVVERELLEDGKG